MATSTIKGGVETFSGTRHSDIDVGGCRGVYDKNTGLVRLNFIAADASNISIDQVLFTIPEAYRPKSNVAGSGFLGTASATMQAGITLYTDGTIKQRSSSNCRHLFGYIEYIL